MNVVVDWQACLGSLNDPRNGRTAINRFHEVLAEARGLSDKEGAPLQMVLIPSYPTQLVQLFSTVFEVRDRATLETATFSVVCFDHYSRVVDALTDNQSNDISSLHDATILLSEGLSAASSIVSDVSRFLAKFNEYLRQASAAE